MISKLEYHCSIPKFISLEVWLDKAATH